MQLIVDMVPAGDHQVEGQVSSKDIQTPMAFSGWLDFIRVIEAMLAPPERDDTSSGIDLRYQPARPGPTCSGPFPATPDTSSGSPL